MATRGQSVARNIREGVLDGTYAPGIRMNEIDISNTLGVSRTPVRAALSALAAEGLLEYVPNSGYVVRQYSSRDIEGVYAVRSVLEGLAARTLAELGMSDEVRGKLHKNLADTKALCDMGEWTEEVARDWSRLNESFHEVIFEATENNHLGELIAKSRSILLLMAMKFRWHDLPSLLDSYTDHAEIFDAISCGQGSRAEHLAREHVYRAGRRLIGNWRRTDTPRQPKRKSERVSNAA